MSIELTEQQRRAVRSAGGAPTVTDPDTQTTYVLVRSEVYERLRAVVDVVTSGESGSEHGPDEGVEYTTAEALDRTMAEDDANDPGLAEIQSLKAALELR
jgi:hypothetical protein